MKGSVTKMMLLRKLVIIWLDETVCWKTKKLHFKTIQWCKKRRIYLLAPVSHWQRFILWNVKPIFLLDTCTLVPICVLQCPKSLYRKSSGGRQKLMVWTCHKVLEVAPEWRCEAINKWSPSDTWKKTADMREQGWPKPVHERYLL